MGFFIPQMFLFLFLFRNAFSLFEEDDSVWVLNEKTFTEALQVQRKLLVEFYAPWCEHCKEFAPEYAKAAKILKKKKIRLAKIDGSAHRAIVDKYEGTGYPTLLYFIDGVPTDYTGPRSAEGVADWVLKRQKNSIQKLDQAENLKESIALHKLSAVYFGKISDSERSVFEFAALNVEEVHFFETENEAHYKLFNITAPKVLVFKENSQIAFDADFSTLELVKFLEKQKPAKVHVFDDQTIKQIFDYQSSAFFYLSTPEDQEKVQSSLEALAQQYRDTLIFTVSDLNTDKNKEKLAEALGISKTDQPLSIIVDFKDSFNKYKFFGTSFDELSEFIKDYLSKKISPYYKSEAIPSEEYENGVKRLVGKNYDEVINDKEKDVFVLYYSPNHPKCKEFLPVYERIAKETRKWENFVVAKFDLEKNEVPGLQIKIIPHLRLFTKDNKDGFIYSGETIKVEIKNYLKRVIKNESFEL